MKRRNFLTTGTAGIVAIGAVGCSSNDPTNPLKSSNAPAVNGIVTDAGGSGIQNVSVTLTGADFKATVLTNESGRYSFDVSSRGEYTILPRKGGYHFNPTSQKIAVNGSKSVVVNIMAIIENTSGSIPVTELGTTGIMVSNFGFGSHVNSSNRGEVREKIIRTAFDYGVNTFDMYDVESNTRQYGPTGKYLAPVKFDVNFSIAMDPDSGLSVEEEIDRVLGLIGKDRVEMVRARSWTKDSNWSYWETLFNLRDQGKIGAVGTPIHQMSDLEVILEEYPDDLDYVIFPYNFYHNIGWPPELHPEWSTFPQLLRDSGIGVVIMKPFAGDYFVNTLKEAAISINPDLSFNQAALRYVINGEMEPDVTLTGMNGFEELIENVGAYLRPDMSDDETALLDGVREVAQKTAHAVLPPHYRFLDQWAPQPDAGYSISEA